MEIIKIIQKNRHSIILFLTLLLIIYLYGLLSNNNIGDYPLINIREKILVNDYPIIVSFYTSDNGYKEHADRLIESLEKNKLSYSIYDINSLNHKWTKICQLKPIVLNKVMEKYKKKNIVWLDADSIVEKEPTLFKKIDKNFGVHYIDGEFASGTLFFKNNNISRNILKDWISENNKSEDAWDQVTLGKIINEKYKNEEYILPKEYCSIFDRKGYQDIDKVISHWQASRKLKNDYKFNKSDNKLFNVNNFDINENDIISINNPYLKEDKKLKWIDPKNNFMKSNYPCTFDFDYSVKNDIINESLKLPKNCGIIDCGAHIGDGSIPIAHALEQNNRKDITVYAIDPSKYKCDFINHMKDINNLKNINVLNYGLTDTDNVKYTHDKLFCNIENTGCTNWIQLNNNENNEISNFITLDSLIKNKIIKHKICLIHLDVEKMEDKAILGGKNYLTNNNVYISLEDHKKDVKKYTKILDNKYNFIKSVHNQLVFKNY